MSSISRGNARDVASQGFASNWRLALVVGMLASAAAVLASQAIDPSFDPFATEQAGGEIASSGESTSLTGVTSPDGVPDQAVVSLSDELPAHDPTVGKLAGEAATSGGAASYRIPIVVPPGRRGVQPDLALVYSSRGGNGIAGMGWSLSGLSAISRCPATLDQDGSNAGVQLTASDRLCLDGQRLIATSGSYGQSGATYTTELASFARVTQLGGALSAAATYFKVETKDGDISYYGGNSTSASDARVIPGGSTIPLTWLIERTQDRLGNFMRYDYTALANGETLLNSILYTGFGSTDGNRHVDFTYEQRPALTGGANDMSLSYVAGSRTVQTRRLRQIATYVDATAVRWYALRYDDPSSYSGRSLLRGIKDCSYRTDGSTVACHRETTFDWQEGTLKSELHRFTVAGLPTGQEMSSLSPVGDLDGDGVQEMVAHYIDPSHATSGDDYVISLAADRSVKGVINTDTLGFVPSSRPVDFNKDGRADMVGWSSGGLSVRIWNNSTTAFVASAFTTYTLPLSMPLGHCVAWNNNFDYPVIGDFNGDGFSDLAVATPVSGGSCVKAPGNSTWNLQVYLGKAGSSPGIPAINSTPAVTKALPYVTQADGAKLNFYPVAVTDFDGDGLADIQFERAQKDFISNTMQEFDLPKMLWFSRNDNGGTTPYSIGGTGNELNSFAAMASPGLDGDETHVEAYTATADINGDGLEDLVSIKYQNGAGYWSIRFNKGGIWGPRIVTTSRRGIEFCNFSSLANRTCGDRWRPMFMPLLSVADTDNDGRAEILAPRAFAMRICAMNTSWVNGEPRDDTFCPENPLTGTVAATPPDPSERFHGVYGNQGSAINPLTVDGSAYYMDAVRFVQTDATTITATTVNTPIIVSGASQSYPRKTLSYDIYGDGLEDYVGPIGAPVAPDTPGSYPYYSTFAYVAGNTTWGPAALPDGTPASAFSNSWRNFIAENPGASSTRNPDGLTPQIPDTLGLVTDGLGAQTGWTYYPLSSRAGRTSSDLPLYTVPASLASRYVDDRHFYFASSMPVVSDMFQSDGTGDVRSWRYGYSEAMYQARGRGFQGFRTITEEDEVAGVRTKTIYSQKFPLTSQIEQVETSALSRAYTDSNGIFKKQIFTWRCNRANRADATACVPPNGTATVVFPFLDEQQTITYDATTASAASGTPAQLGYQRSVAADDSTCAGGLATTSGYDANGNLLASTVLTYDGNGSVSGNGSGGTREFIGIHCVRTRSVYATADTTNWWLDKLNSRTVTTAIAYNTTIHPLPAGVTNPQQSVATTYTWNTNRTPDTEVVQSGITDQQTTTKYGYPASPNYGLPTSVTITPTGTSAGPRTTGTTYSADGYFPATVTNALSHQVTTTIRPEDGQPTLVTDANGLRTKYQYDAFGFNNLTQYRGATDGEMVAPDRAASLTWCGSCFAQGDFRMTVVQDGSPTSVVDSDLLGREVGNAHHLADGTWSRVAKQYNAAGQLASESAPYRSGTIYWTLYDDYDVAGRLLRKVAPRANQDGRGDMVTTYAYAGRTTNIQVCGENDANSTNCLNLSRTQDSLGRYVETIDGNGGTTKFWYDGTGNALAIRDANGAIISAIYNAINQRTAVDDPNQGDWSFGYNSLGELITQTDARNITTTTGYDKLSRPLQRSATYDYDGVGATDTVIDSWTYDPTYGKGFEGSNTRKVNALTLRTESTTFDTLARPMSRSLTQLRANNSTADSVTQETAYDSYYGRPKAQGSGNDEVLWLRYSKYGDLTQESNPTTGGDYRVVNSVDERGQPMAETWGAGNLTVTRSYLPQTGQVASIDYASSSNPNLRTFDYAYDVFGNLGQQDLNGGATRETYDYDAVQRLTEATRTGGASGTVDYTYDAIGNLTSKSDFSTTATNAYAYTGGSCGGGPNAVKSVALKAGGSRTYCYDAAGNMTGDSASLSVRYDHTQRPLFIARGAINQSFDYAPSGEKFRESGTDGEVEFFGKLERRYSPTAQDKVYAASNAVVTQTGATRVVQYLLTDRLGSVDAIAYPSGALVETRGYDAFGKPRTGTWADATPPRLGTIANTAHGFTGHEHLNSLELIHMNGRVYDYNLGRFMEVDPIIQSPLNSQSLNPYSYIGNNPLSGTDPTGYFGEGLPCIMPTWACRQQVTGQGPDESFGFLATMAKLGLSQGGLAPNRLTNGAQEKVRTYISLNEKAGSGSLGPTLWGGAGCATSGPNDCSPAKTYGMGDSLNSSPAPIEELPDALAISRWMLNRFEVLSNESIEPIPVLGVEVLADSAQSVHDEVLRTEGLSIETAGTIMTAALASMMHMPYAAPRRMTTPIGELRAAGQNDAHHVIQDAAVRDLPGYNSRQAPGVQLRGPSTALGSEHYIATVIQRAGGGGTYAAERRIAYKALRKAGFSERDARDTMVEVDAYFGGIGVRMDTPTRIPGNRR